MACTVYCFIFLVSVFTGDLLQFTDANSAPIFFNLPGKVELREDTTVGTEVFTMFGYDFDPHTSPNGRYHYILTPIDHTDFKFSVDASLGFMYLVQPLDYESKNSYTLMAEIADVGSPPKSSRGNIFVDVLDVNDNRPNCRSLNMIGALSEDSPVGSSIAQLNCTDPDTGDGGVIDYEIIAGNSDIIEVSSTGEATLKRMVDFDTEGGTFEVDVKIKDRGTPQLFSMAKVILSLKDIDDLQPQFTQPSGYTEHIQENSPLGTTIFILTANDGDAPNTDASLVNYGLETTPVPDWLNVDPFSGSVVVKRNIDWEQHNSIECDVYAYSSEMFDNRTVVHVTILVDDVNDGVPTFDKDYYEVFINESNPANVIVATINATDLDDGPDGQVTYSILSGSSIFDINNETGLMTLLQPLDYEVSKSHLLTVVARDGGNPATSSSVFVQVSVLPENEFDPVFQPPFTFDVSEDLAPGSSVFTIITKDDDDGLDGLIGYQVVNLDVPFLVDAGTGVLRVAYDLDFETTTSYMVTVEAVDNSTTVRRTVQQTFLVNITDANDVAAVCDYVPTHVIKYPFMIGQPILNVTCTDVDTAQSGLRYNVSKGNDGTFTIGNTGSLSLVHPPLKSHYDLTVEVDDGGGQITPTSFTIFTETELSFRNLQSIIYLNESMSFLTPPFDTNPGYAFPPVTSRIVSGNEDYRLILQPGSGLIKFGLDFDREVEANRTYTIQATSPSGQNETKVFTVQVQDMNDNTPIFDNTAYRLRVSENFPTNSSIYLFTAVDPDDDVNSLLNYSIPVGNEDGIFAINETGWLWLVKPLHYESIDLHILEIEAYDDGSPSLTGTTTVAIVVIDEQEDPPQILPLSGLAEAVMLEDAALGSVAFHLTLPISTAQDAVVFSFKSGNEDGFFGLESSTGKIFLAKYLDRETLSFYSLGIKAVTLNGSVAEGVLNVSVGDVNDNFPKFSKTVYLFELDHGEPVGTTIANLQVTDADDGVNANVSLKLISGNIGNAFAFSGTVLKTTIKMNYHAVSSYNMIVRASDAGSPPKTTDSVIHITILPVTSLPQFPERNQSINVEESAPVGSLVIDLDATALGSSETDGSIRYEIKSGNLHTHFSIDTDNGALTIVEALNYESETSYNLVIAAINTVDPLQRDEMTLMVEVDNVNEFSPSFDHPSYHWTISELKTINFTVGSVTVTDQDDGAFGEFTTTIMGTDDFQIDSATGDIVLSKSIDYLRQNLYTLILNSTDHGVPPRYSLSSLTIEVIDENNHTPTLPAFSAIQIYSLIPIGSEIFHVNAEDLDTGDAGNITYTVLPSTNTCQFSIDTYTGILTTVETCDVGVYRLKIEAHDGGTPPRLGPTEIEITVLPGYGDNTAPVFTLGSTTSLTVNRKASPGENLAEILATDVDANIMSYYISSGNEDGYFLIDEDSGNLTAATWLLNSENAYILQIHVLDDGKPPKSDSILVNIDVNPPRTESSTSDYGFNVSESVSIGYIVGRINADTNRQVLSYTILSGNHGNSFIIERQSPSGDGLVKTENLLDFEDFWKYSLQVQVTSDLGNDTKIIEIQLTDVNDEIPSFPSSTLTLPLAEHTQVGFTLTTIEYQDKDYTTSFRDSTLSINNNGPTNYLGIDQSGHLSLLVSPDFDTVQQLIAKVIVTQSPFPPTTLDVTVNIVDVDEIQIIETPPSGRPIFISLELPHRVGNGYNVHNLTLANFGISSASSYEFVSFDVAPPFSVHSSSGAITVTSAETLVANKYYFRWVVCRTPTESVMALVRLDTFDRDNNMAVVEFGDSLSTAIGNKERFLSRAQAFFLDNQRVGLVFIFEETSTPAARRRLLATSSAAGIYVVQDASVDDVGQVNAAKQFLTQSQILSKLQQSSDGTPVDGLSNPSVLTVNRVVGYGTAEDEEEPFLSSAAGIAILTLVCLLILIGGLFIYFMVKKYCCSSKSKDMSVDDKYDKKNGKLNIENEDQIEMDKENDDIILPLPKRKRAIVFPKTGDKNKNNNKKGGGKDDKKKNKQKNGISPIILVEGKENPAYLSDVEDSPRRIEREKTDGKDSCRSPATLDIGKDNASFFSDDDKGTEKANNSNNNISSNKEQIILTPKTQILKLDLPKDPESTTGECGSSSKSYWDDTPPTTPPKKDKRPPSPLTPSRHVTDLSLLSSDDEK